MLNYKQECFTWRTLCHASGGQMTLQDGATFVELKIFCFVCWLICECIFNYQSTTYLTYLVFYWSELLSLTQRPIERAKEQEKPIHVSVGAVTRDNLLHVHSAQEWLTKSSYLLLHVVALLSCYCLPHLLLRGYLMMQEKYICVTHSWELHLIN